MRPNEEQFSWNLLEDSTKGWYLMKLLEEAGFGYKVSVKAVNGTIDAGSLNEMVENMMLGRAMLFKNYSEDENARIPTLLGEELSKLAAYRETEKGVEIETVAWIGVATK